MRLTTRSDSNGRNDPANHTTERYAKGLAFERWEVAEWLQNIAVSRDLQRHRNRLASAIRLGALDGAAIGAVTRAIEERRRALEAVRT